MHTPALRISEQLAAVFEAEDQSDVVFHGDVDQYGFRLLTVCTGNICRSALSEGLLRSEVDAITNDLVLDEAFFSVSSSGVGAVVGAPADAEVQRIAARQGLSLAAHRGRQFEVHHAESAHLILTATRRHRDAVIEQAPSSAPRCFTLAEFVALLDAIEIGDGGEGAPPRRPTRMSRRLQRFIATAHQSRQGRESGEEDDIEDPYRKDREVHERVAERIRVACEIVGARLRSELA